MQKLIYLHTMKSMKLMLPALLLSLSLGAFAQDDDELMDATSEEDAAAEVFVPSHPWEKPIFYRVQLGYLGTSAKYTNNSQNKSITILGNESHFLSGVSLGVISDIVLTKNRNLPLYAEVGALLNYQTGHYDGDRKKNSTQKEIWHSRVYSLSMTIPINLSYQFRDIEKLKGITLAPFVGVYGRFNFVADRRLKLETENYTYDGVLQDTKVEYKTMSLMKADPDGWAKAKPNAGKLFQMGAQVGVNAFYKRFSFGLQYMYEFIPFANNYSEEGNQKKPNDVGGYTVTAGTGTDMEITTKHNFAITVGYFF